MSLLRARGDVRGIAGWACLCALLCVGCKDPAERQAKAEARARAARAAEEMAAQKEASRRGEEARAEEARKAEATQQAAMAEKARNSLSTCCQALARRGFEERSMPDMAAKSVCLELAAKDDSLASARPRLTAALEGRQLPSACAGAD